ncbi:MAG: aminopeptidase P family protein [Alphaproteobacteria bacterium]|nr:aminopeptidase P family protein [Alphaproteobacteria bacterium]
MTSARLQSLREELARCGADAVLIPRGDCFQGEEVPASEDRLAFISGFTGSAGVAVVTKDKAALFSDGRYTIQMAAETTSDWSCHTMPEASVTAWLKDNLTAGAVAIDPWLMTLSSYRQFQKAFTDSGLSVMKLDHNLVDVIWPDRPLPPSQPAWDYPQQYQGQSRQEKITAAITQLKDSGARQMLITGPDQLNWLLNIRGNDIPHSPLFLAFGLLRDDGTVVIFTEDDRVKSIDQNALTVIPPSDMLDHLAGLSRMTIAIDPATCPYVLADLLDGQTVEAASIITALKARKNPVEIAGVHHAHRRDAVAMVRMLAWLDASSGLREVDVAEKLLELRAEVDGFISASFATICGSGPNGAIVHYRAEEGSDSEILTDTLCLIDSGGQYLDATTDITRTVAIGEPTAQMRHDFTHVLKAHIALDQAVFPKGTTGAQLDAITRAPLWAAGMDFAHGTGHGVGCCLNVHEGPANISKRGTVALEAGMVLSNEPGHYIEGQYGIRIENLLVVRPEDGREGYLGFDHVTLVPMDRRLIDLAHLTSDELRWLNDYHARVAEVIRPLVVDRGDDDVLAWFDAATQRI